MKPNQYRLTFSWQGLLAMFLLQCPNIIWMMWPPANNPLALNSTPWPILDILENGSLVIMMLSLIFIRPKHGNASMHAKEMLVVAGVSILAYYTLWVLYTNAIFSPFVFLGMAVFPVLYYTFLTLRVRNYIILPVIALFAILHVGITAYNFLL